jgi:hypothetical protein
MDYQGAVTAAFRSYSITVAVILALYGIIAGGFSAWLASAKGYDGAAWFFLGLLFGLFALMAVGFAPVKEPPAEPGADSYKDSKLVSLQATELEKIKKLLDGGKITMAEYNKAKAQILGL